ncbi:MAG: DinB family protein [Candidatus Promineofilum sp.]|nr:DinB family protein [Promineifilum sp.]
MSALEDILDELDAGRERTLVALETLPDEALIAPGVIGRWSVADLLSILTAWDAEVVTGLLRLEQGKPPEKLLAALTNPSLYNAARYQDAQGRDLDVVFEDFQGARLHLEEWLSDLSERALTDPRHYKSLGGVALGKIIAQATYKQEARYLPFLTAFADRWEAAEEEAASVIMPADIDVMDTGDRPPSNGSGPEETQQDE